MAQEPREPRSSGKKKPASSAAFWIVSSGVPAFTVIVIEAGSISSIPVMNIPGSVSVPGAELVLRAGQAAPDPDTTIIVNCAGRTRSIIGTQSLINAGVPNKVRALRNGTIGWTLARHTLNHGADRRGAIGPFEGGPANARDVAYRAGVRRIGASEMAVLLADRDRTLYRFDVRDAEEYATGHLPGFRHYPGGQLVQETDMLPETSRQSAVSEGRRSASW